MAHFLLKILSGHNYPRIADFMNAISIKCGLFFACLLGAAATASATSFTVDALLNSSNSGAGTGLGTLILTAGDSFSISVNPLDLWNAGPLPRWSNADGLTHDLYATGSDESGYAAGILIGTDWGTHTEGSFSAPFGALVGQIGSGGSFFFVGTSFTGVAANSGQLLLYYWDSYTPDNTDSVTIEATVRRLPEGGLTAMLLGMGMMALGFVRRMLK